MFACTCILAKIQALKKTVPKGDKRRKKEVAAEISILEQQLEEIEKQKQITDTAVHTVKESETMERENSLFDGEVSGDSSSSGQTATKMSRSKKKKVTKPYVLSLTVTVCTGCTCRNERQDKKGRENSGL